MLTQKQLSHMVIQKNQNLIHFADLIMKNKKGHIKSVPVRIQYDIVGKGLPAVCREMGRFPV
ncbi:MAG: hypothetical protein C0403_16590 [Desulfobacterium sp.]|nr:hypothetical protein [Desulfobacterium sp.]